MDIIELREYLTEDDPFLSRYITFKSWHEEYFRLHLSIKGSVPTANEGTLLEWYSAKVTPEELIHLLDTYGDYEYTNNADLIED